MHRSTPKKVLEGFAYAGPLAIQLGNILCKVFNSAGNVALTHAVATINMVAALAIVG
jgi:hypothetical protein